MNIERPISIKGKRLKIIYKIRRIEIGCLLCYERNVCFAEQRKDYL
jgi:hypothetical protein